MGLEVRLRDALHPVDLDLNVPPARLGVRHFVYRLLVNLPEREVSPHDKFHKPRVLRLPSVIIPQFPPILHLHAVYAEARPGVEFLVADVALEVLGLLVLDQDLLVIKLAVAVPAQN